MILVMSLNTRRSIFVLEDNYFLVNDRNVFSLCLAECSDYELYEFVEDYESDDGQGDMETLSE